MAGPGPRQLVAAPQHEVPIYTLLDAAEIVTEDDGDWLNGIKYRRERCGVAQARAVGCEPDGLESLDNALAVSRDSNEIDTDPFLVWDGDTCSTFGWEQNDYIGRAERQLRASEAYAVEHEFWTGEQAKVAIAAGHDYPDDQWLAQSVTCTTLNGGAVTNIALAVGLLQQALGDCAGGGRGMIHMPAKVLNALLTVMTVTPDSPNGEPPKVISDIRGNLIVPGFGYSANLGPNGVAAPAGQAWLYATGLVRIFRNPPKVYPDTLAQATNRLTNDVTYRVERNYLVDWDRCCHFAVLVKADLATDAGV